MAKTGWKSYYLYYILEGLMLLATLILLIHGIIHPRPYKWCLLVMMLLFEIEIYANIRRVKSGKKKATSIVLYLLGIPMGLYLTYAVSLFWFAGYSIHMPWEYKGDIKALKAESPDRYYFFPDEIPKGAIDVEWRMQQGLMQGQPSEYLKFRINKEYIQKVVSNYGSNAELLEYDSKYKMWSAYFPSEREIEEGREEFVEVYIIYTDPDNEISVGFFVDEEKGLIVYFRE